MASSAGFAVLLVLAVAAQCARGGQLACEDLPADVCAFAVSSAGRRCVLERTPDGAQRCQTSAVGVETDACVRACGVDRAVLGLPIASAVAEDRRSFSALCSSACRDVCPDVVDLYATVAAAEGMSLPVLCEAQNKAGNRRMLTSTIPPVGAPEADAPAA
ncbi:hypothetical protein BDA96_09G166100 [Sorghum bicolor]|uniref:PAR1 protein n=2 Tax=Sorghum bicolor TaxID=4558 RepID=A0A921U4D0_SORBI|nr:uncharacterized protein LOC8072521 isoform X2 [Sorghum bicolor]EES18324.1 hypothetical protein SORBI_3009G158200 [Sorghum bicolor]KAG0518322.1 hypothetical protein BDA96_09G166100 [Sorghum bicolor]|eukprot:XP_002439894.1 uncharacterized protein LOC8072521 isoform X2 [Sorghum bicolor]